MNSLFAPGGALDGESRVAEGGADGRRGLRGGRDPDHRLGRHGSPPAAGGEPTGSGGGGRLQLVRSRTGEQLIEQHTQRVDIAAHIDRIAPQQLGAGVVGREGPTVETGELPRRRIGLFARQQFRHSKVQQPHLPRVGHQYVGGLQIPMDDAFAVRELDRG